MNSAMPRRWRRFLLLAAWTLFAVSALRTLHQAYEWDMPKAPRRDFVQLYAGARCLLAGQDPYNTQLLEQQYISGGGVKEHLPDWHYELPLYPPSALLFGMPFAAHSYYAASAVWFWAGAVAMLSGIAALPLLVPREWRWLAVLLAACSVAIPSSTLVAGMGQPAALTMGLLFLGVVAALRGWKAPVAVALFTLALLLKLQLSLPFVFYLLLTRPYRRIAISALGLWLAVSLGCVVFMRYSPQMHGWLPTLRANMAASQATGGSNNSEPTNKLALTFTNLQAVTSLFFRSARAYSLASWAFVLPVGAVWLAACIMRPWSPTRDRLALAAAAALTLLPVYSAYYNLPLLAFTVPAVVGLLFMHRAWGVVALVCLLPAAFWNLQLHVQHVFVTHPALAPHGALATAVFLREYPLSIALSAVVLVAALWTFAPEQPA